MVLDTSYEIRPARRDDAPAMQSIYSEAVANSLATWDETAPDAARFGARLEGLAAAGYPAFVADHAYDGIAGYVTTGPFHPQTGWRHTAEQSIYIAPEHHGSGMGRALVEALVPELRLAGFRVLLAGVSIPGGEGSLRFHEKLGFVERGRFPGTGFKNGIWLTAIYLQLDLDI